tara:strand:- start:1658 stop:1822 length:165 start_codon:yes stop_codon:yes gene_type:complete
MKYLITTAENEIYYTNELTDDIVELSESDLVIIVDVAEELYLCEGSWVEIPVYE